MEQNPLMGITPHIYIERIENEENKMNTLNVSAGQTNQAAQPQQPTTAGVLLDPTGGLNLPYTTWTDNVLSFSGATVDFQLQMVTTPRGKIPFAYLPDYLHFLAADNGRHYGLNDLERRVIYWGAQQQKAMLVQLQAKVDFAALNDLVADFVFLITGTRNPLHIAVIQHLIWQVKRKLFGLPITNHMMPVLFGKTGCGKSIAIKLLCSPLEEVFDSGASLEAIDDKFGNDRFQNYYIIFFDELAKMTKVDSGNLKRVITSTVLSARKMRSQLIQRVINNSTFIGATNTPLGVLLKDDTSARRFWEIQTLEKSELCRNWDQINNLDFLKLWQGVDQNVASPIEPFLDQINAIQHSHLRAQSVIEQWSEEIIVSDPNGFESIVSLHDGYLEYHARMQQRTSPLGKTEFARHLEALGYKRARRNHAKGFAVSFRVGLDPMNSTFKFNGDSSNGLHN